MNQPKGGYKYPSPPGTQRTVTQSQSSPPTPLFSPIEWKGEAGETILPPQMRHVVLVTGHRGSGKTTFMLQLENPANTIMLDYEGKGEGLAKPLGIDNYFAPCDDCADVHGFGYRAYHIFRRTKQILEDLPRDRFTTLILDNAALLQEGCYEEVKLDPTKFGIDPERAEKGSWGGAWPGVKFLLKSLFQVAHNKGIQVIAVSFQPGKAWGEKAPLVNKFKISDVAIWHEMSILSLVLGPGTEKGFPAPSALVFKEQLGQLTFDKETKQHIVRRVLPLKLPIATPAEVYRYLKEPANLKSPQPFERPEDGELDPWSPTFGKEQLKTILALAKLQSEEGEGE